MWTPQFHGEVRKWTVAFKCFHTSFCKSQHFLLFRLGQFFAHSHKDDFRLQMFELETSITAKSFVLLAPAISPVYHNNPAFRLVSLDTDQQSLADYTQYYMDLVMATREFWFNKVNKDFSRVEIFLCIRAALHFFHLLEKIGIHVICGIFLKYNPVNWPLFAASNLAVIVMIKLLLWNNERACHTHFTMNDIKQLLDSTEYDMKNYADRGGCITANSL